MEILLSILIFISGLIFGFGLRSVLLRSQHDGIIFVTKQDEKMVYTLELDGDPENLMYQEEVVFRVRTLEESLDRD